MTVVAVLFSVADGLVCSRIRGGTWRFVIVDDKGNCHWNLWSQMVKHSLECCTNENGGTFFVILTANAILDSVANMLVGLRRIG